MQIRDIVTYHVKLPLIHPFQTSFGKFEAKDAILVRLITENGIEGWGETASLGTPLYSPDFTQSDRIIQEQFIIPYLIGRKGKSVTDFLDVFKPIRGHSFAKAGVEMAIWDALAKEADLPLWKYLGGVTEHVPCGISIGIQSDIDTLLQRVEYGLDEGYQRIKIKIKKGYDVEPVRAIRETFGDIPLMVDANSDYTLLPEDVSTLKALDEFDLIMIEQPLHYNDIWNHGKIQRQLSTPICLDESIHSVDDAQFAIDNRSCRIINIKPGRVGGLYNSIQIHNYAKNNVLKSFTHYNYSNPIPLWVGGMLETGVGRAHNIALNSLEGFTMVGDISSSDRYWEKDVVLRPAQMKDGFIAQRDDPGIGYEVDMQMIEEMCD